MRIRSQLIITEMSLSAVLFLSVLFSITSFVRFIGFEDLKIKTAALQETAVETRFAAMRMLVSSEPGSYLANEYFVLEDQLARDIRAIVDDELFNRLPEDIRDRFDVIERSWELTHQSLNVEEMAANLEVRDIAPGNRPVSIETLLALTWEGLEVPYTTTRTIVDTVQILRRHDQTFNNFETLLSQVIAEMLQAANSFRQARLLTAVGIPALVLLVAFMVVFFYSGVLSRKLLRLDGALNDIAGGDFSVRVDMKGRDEFNSLATSVNAFTRTLGAKLESFRLVMHEIGETLSTNIESSQVEETLIRLAMRDTVADGAALYKVEGEEGELVLSVTEGRYRPPYPVSDLPEAPEEEDIVAILRSRIIQPGRTVIGESAVQGRSILIRDVAAPDGPDWNRPAGDSMFLSSLMAVPLQIGSTVFGVIVLTSSRVGRLFSDLEYANMQSFGELAAITLDNIYKYADLLEVTQLNRELGIAEEIQQDLLPKRLPRLAAGEVAYLSRSIKGLNGDYFDVYPLGDGKTMLTICEVAGRGVPAGLVMVMLRTILRLVASSDMDARSVMTRLNQDMTRRIAIENYASVGILILDNDGTFTFSSAAHYPLQVFRSDGTGYETIQTEGIPVGIDRNAEYAQQRGRLGIEDLILFHTDGIPESRNRNGQVFGIESLLNVVGKQASESPEKIIETLRTELEHFEKGTAQKDDQTVIILKYTGGSAA